MLTECPNPRCRLTFEVPDEKAGKNGPCPDCGQVITFRSREILKQIEKERRRREHAGAARGGADAPPGSERLVALLEDVRSLWNVGSIFRTADGAGFARLHLCGITGCPPRKEIAKTSLGAEDHVAWAYHASALEILPHLKAAGVLVVGLELAPGSRPLSDALESGELRAPLCVAVGNEVSGLAAETLACCDVVCHLPMRGSKGSLNVAVAFGVAAYRCAERLLVE